MTGEEAIDIFERSTGRFGIEEIYYETIRFVIIEAVGNLPIGIKAKLKMVQMM